MYTCIHSEEEDALELDDIRPPGDDFEFKKPQPIPEEEGDCDEE